MVTTVVSPERSQVPIGAVLRIPATWAAYQALMQQRGDGSVPRMKYRNGELLLMSPLLVHGRDASLLADIAKVLLDHNEREYDAFTPVTMDLPEESGIEPDYCFYIDNWEAVSGKERIDWQVDPPPNLAIEVDVTSYTDVADYAAYGVPEFWLWKRLLLSIYGLIDGGMLKVIALLQRGVRSFQVDTGKRLRSSVIAEPVVSKLIPVRYSSISCPEAPRNSY